LLLGFTDIGGSTDRVLKMSHYLIFSFIGRRWSNMLDFPIKVPSRGGPSPLVARRRIGPDGRASSAASGV
jgi:hypothetical protein